MDDQEEALFPRRKAPDFDPAKKALISRAQRGDEQAFAALFNLYKASVYTLCSGVAANVAEAEEMTLDVFLAAFRGIGACHDFEAFSNRLFQLTAGAMTACRAADTTATIA